MDEAAEITGRDDFIIAKARYYAMKYIDSLPPPERELSDQNDMQMILNERFPGLEATFTGIDMNRP